MSQIGGAESEGSIPDLDKGEEISAEELQVKLKILKQAVAANLKVNLKCMGKSWHHY